MFDKDKLMKNAINFISIFEFNISNLCFVVYISNKKRTDINVTIRGEEKKNHG
jgi:hypothetical protein